MDNGYVSPLKKQINNNNKQKQNKHSKTYKLIHDLQNSIFSQSILTVLFVD